MRESAENDRDKFLGMGKSNKKSLSCDFINQNYNVDEDV